ncbi:MAG: hypothetical protein IJ683_14580 [Butyrivibrio sp.]|nr:hypothetical protein [Butyrivibrio sp.]MBR1643534.1 hypothetical protein [Butyrivibrio sp.]
MKKVLGLLVALLLAAMPLIACAAQIDYSAMSVEELNEVVNSARNEILKKTTAQDKLYLVDDPSGVSMYLTGNGENGWLGTYDIEVVVINNTTTNLSIYFDNIVVNGWETNALYSSISSTSAGRKQKAALSLQLEEAEISSSDEIEEVEISFHTYDDDYNIVSKYGPIVFFYDGSAWSK